MKRYFGLETEWDNLEKNIVGSYEIDIEFENIILVQDKRTKANKVYRPVRKLSQDIIPLAHSSDSAWNNDDNNSNIYPVVAVKFGRGFLIHTGMSLDEEREYKNLDGYYNKTLYYWLSNVGRVIRRFSNNRSANI